MNSAEVEHDRQFTITVIATSAKHIEVRPQEQIQTAKRAALREFGIPQDKADEYRLASAPGDPASEFDDHKKVTDYGLHSGSKVFLVKPHNDA